MSTGNVVRGKLYCCKLKNLENVLKYELISTCKLTLNKYLHNTWISTRLVVFFVITTSKSEQICIHLSHLILIVCLSYSTRSLDHCRNFFSDRNKLHYWRTTSVILWGKNVFASQLKWKSSITWNKEVCNFHIDALYNMQGQIKTLGYHI